MPCCGENQNLYRQQTWGISAREMGERGRERWARAEISGTMLQPHFYFYLGFDEVIIDDLSFFREPSMPFYACSNTNVRSHRGKHKSERRWSAPRTSPTLPCTSFSRKGRTQTSHPTLFLRYASRIYLRLVVQTMLPNSGQNEINVDDSSHAVQRYGLL
jgi:hypothetical protein